jgi:hypothetical protein
MVAPISRSNLGYPLLLSDRVSLVVRMRYQSLLDSVSRRPALSSLPVFHARFESHGDEGITREPP